MMYQTFKIIIIALAILFLFSCKTVKNDTKIRKDIANKVYLELLKKELPDINSRYGTMEQLNRLKRLDALYPNKYWVKYYQALLNVRLSFTAYPEQKELLIKEAEEILKFLETNGIDNMKSEFYTLKGYALYARIAQDPSTNGPLYFNDIITFYQKALEYDQNNPRAKLLLLTFKNSMSEFLKETSIENLCADVNDLREILRKSLTDSIRITPSWGMNEANRIYSENCPDK